MTWMNLKTLLSVFAAIEITNEGLDKNDKFRARVHVEEVRRSKTGSPTYHSQGRRENECMMDKEVELINRKGETKLLFI